MARYMQENVPGIRLPEAMAVRMEGAADGKEEGIAIAVETIQAVRQMPGIAGVHMMPVAWESVIPIVVERAGLSPRPKVPVLVEA